MKRVLLASIAILFAATIGVEAFADQSVRGYTRKDGAYVQPHHRSSPNSTTRDNWSTRGNVNPYTGQMGTRDPSPSYNSGFGSRPGYGSNPYSRR